MSKSPKLTRDGRQGLVQAGYGSIVLEGAGGITTSPVWSRLPEEGTNGRILVIVELSGGNDGLNTIVPTDAARHPAWLRRQSGDPAGAPRPATPATATAV